ncbi:oxidoreductase [Streptosporangium sp. NBC_01495]|uniref:oxidoreductase n=1 Tax=Streptosporangium sp. NBC_01495 TaxID=2903899 RepID=UPI002E31FBE4|nr:oxidoreductase [Streptosporangium sp. NBC_01495]
MSNSATSTWTDRDVPSQNGKLAMVTGANSGIGRHTALELARAGATVLLAGRSTSALDETATAIGAEVPGARLETVVLDLADLSSIGAAAGKVLALDRPLDLLVNNAGVMAVPERRTTADGFELTFGTNHLGHFALTGHLLPALLRAEAARVVTVSAIAFRWRMGELVDLNSERRYSAMGSYAKSKRANVVFTRELSRRAHGTNLVPVVVHPGASQTSLQQHTPRWMRALSAPLNRLMFQPTDRAAWPSLYAATHPGLGGGEFVGPTGRQGMHGSPGVLSLSKNVTDPETGRALWDASERLTGVTYRF